MALDLENFEQRGQFWYRCGKRSTKAHELRICAECDHACMIARERIARGQGQFCSVRCALSGGRSPFAGKTRELSSRWVGDSVGYVGAHVRVYAARGRATECIFGCQGAWRYEWANLTGDYLDVSDYAQMCVGCHRRFDQAIREMEMEG